MQWSEITGADLPARCKAGKSEFPSGFTPVSFSTPAHAIRVGDGAFVFDDGWRVVTRTGAWPFAAHPRGSWAILEVPWKEAAGLLALEDAAPFPFEAVIESALVGEPYYWRGRAVSFLLEGFPMSARLHALASSVAKNLPGTDAAKMTAALAALAVRDE